MNALKKIVIFSSTLLSISTLADSAPKKIFIQFKIDNESTQKMLERTEEIRTALLKELAEKNYVEEKSEANADVKLVLNASHGVEPYTGAIKGCEAYLGISNLPSQSRKMTETFGKASPFMSAKRCAKKVKALFSDIPSSKFFGS